MQILRPRLAKVLAAAAIGTLFVVLAFRFAVYRHMYIGPDDPHGISDIIELMLGCLLIGVVGIATLASIALAIKGPRQNRVAAGGLLLVCVLIAALVEPLHALAARWAP